MTGLDQSTHPLAEGSEPRSASASERFPSPNPPWTVLIVDDDPEYLADTAAEVMQRACAPDGNPPHVLTEQSFSKAEYLLRTSTVDVVILDVRDDQTEGGAPDDDRGVRVFEDLKRLRFVPVVFFTAIESRVQELDAPPLVQVVSKADGSEAAAAAVEVAFRSGAPVAVRALGDHVREVMRKYLWEHIGPRWAAYQGAPRDQLANLLASRLAKSLEHTSAHELQGALGDAMPTPRDWHPSRMYVVPPLSAGHSTGDVVRDSVGAYSVLLTPECDLEVRSSGECKAEHIMLARGQLLKELPVFTNWFAADLAFRVSGEAMPPGGYEAADSIKHKALKKTAGETSAELKPLLKGTTVDRYFHLPGFLDIPDLLIDLQHVESKPHGTLESLTPVASLNAPYAQALLSRFSRYVGRVGLDDPDTEWLLEGFRKTTANTTEPVL